MAMSNITSEIVNIKEQIHTLIDSLVTSALSVQSPPTLYLDLEGVDLCRYSTLFMLTILIYTGIPTRHAYLIDGHTLGAQVFETIGSKYKSLKDVLQDEKIVKVFFDVRNDSDALFAHFGVALEGGRRYLAHGECDEEDYSIKEILERLE